MIHLWGGSMVYNARAQRLSNRATYGFSTNAVLSMTPSGRIACMRLTQLAIGALALACFAGPAVAQDQVGNMNEMRSRSSRMDDLKNPGPAALDEEGLRGESDQLDVQGHGTSIDGLREANRGWQPPPCDGTLPESAKAPGGADPDEWDLAFDRAEDRLERSRKVWREFETGAVVARVQPGSGQKPGEATRQALEKSRDQYADARCSLQGLFLEARRQDVPAGVLRAHMDKLPSDLRP
jgi:hypothetical protein